MAAQRQLALLEHLPAKSLAPYLQCVCAAFSCFSIAFRPPPSASHSTH